MNLSPLDRGARQRHAKPRAITQRAVHVDLAPMDLDDALGDREPKAGTACAVCCASTPIKPTVERGRAALTVVIGRASEAAETQGGCRKCGDRAPGPAIVRAFPADSDWALNCRRRSIAWRPLG